MAERYPMHPDAQRNNQWARALRSAHDAPRCWARTRRGTLCQAPACGGRRRCRMHGGRSLSGEHHGRYVHGFATAEARAERRMLGEHVRACGDVLAQLHAEHGGTCLTMTAHGARLRHSFDKSTGGRG